MRILIVLHEPPPASSGMGTLWGKLSLGLTRFGIEVAFFGPDPAECYPVRNTSIFRSSASLYFKGCPFERRCSVRRNSSAGFRRFMWSVGLGLAKMIRRAGLGEEYSRWIRRRAAEDLPLHAAGFDVLGVHASDLTLCQTVACTAKDLGIPFLLVIGDPVGSRTVEGFTPEMPDAQESLIGAAWRVLMTRPTYELCYRDKFPELHAKFVEFSDCFMAPATTEGPSSTSEKTIVLHWGSIPPWRETRALAQALQFAKDLPSGANLVLRVCGRITDPDQRAHMVAALGDAYQEVPAGPYDESRKMMCDAAVILVIVSKRHRDNVPSKLIDSLPFGKPILLLGPESCASADIVRELGVGLVAPPDDWERIAESLRALIAQPDRFRSNLLPAAIDRFSQDAVCAQVAEGLLVI